MHGKFLILIISVLITLSCSSDQKNQETVIVSVGEGVLTLENLNKAIPSAIQPTISQEQINNYIQQWIETELLYRDALRIGLDRDKEFQLELERAKRELLVRRYLDHYMSEGDDITEDEAREYYEENKDSYVLTDDEIRSLHILVSTEAEANNVYKRIRSGEDFEAVAREVSKDYIENGRIDLGYFKRQDIALDIAVKVFNHPVQSITSPIRSNFGYHIFKIVDYKRNGSYRDFDGVKDQIIARLKTIKRNGKYRDLIIELRNRIDIKKYPELLKKFYNDSTHQKISRVFLSGSQ